MEKVVINPEVAVKAVEYMIACEKFYNSLIRELGDALQFIASPNEEMNQLEIRMSVLQTIAVARLDFCQNVERINQLKRGEVPEIYDVD